MNIMALSTADDFQIADLSRVLLCCVRAGATVGYLREMSLETAGNYWRGTLDSARAGRLVLLAASGQDAAIVGTAQLSIHFPPNQPHVAGLNMLLVHPDYRRRGIAGALLKTVEVIARTLGRTLMMLQTARGSDAERLYVHHGFKIAGIVPGFALHPDGHLTDGAIYTKQIRGLPAGDSVIGSRPGIAESPG